MDPITLAALIGGGSALISGFLGSNAANNAASAQEQSSLAALGLQGRMYDQSRTDSAPWLDAGKRALAQYQNEIGIGPQAQAQTFKSSFQESPDYQFTVSQGEKGVVNNMRGLGMGASGSAMKALTRFREGVAHNFMGDYLNRISGLAGVGQTQANSNATLGANYGTTAGQTMQDAGTARASSYTGAANSWTSALSGAANNFTSSLGNYDQKWNYAGA